MRIFLASSNELKHEREYLAGVVLYLGRLLHDLGTGQRVELVKWEYLDSSMGIEHKQDEYNRELAACDVTVVLFGRKFGEFTESELLTALRCVKEDGKKHRLGVLFKDTQEKVTPELAAYRSSLADRDGIMLGTFATDDELRGLFLKVVFASLCEGHADFEIPTDNLLRKYVLK